MKHLWIKLTITLFLLLSTLISMAQNAEETQSCVVRKGNTYYVDDMTYTKKGFRVFLSKDMDSNAFKLFNNGYKLSVGGWACLGAGLGVMTVGGIYYASSNNELNSDKKSSIGTDFGNIMVNLLGQSIIIIGSAAVAVGIPLVAVGYSRMHTAADMYNANCKQPSATLSLNADYNGLGLAVNF